MSSKHHDVPAAEFHLGSFLPFRLSVVSENMARLFSENYAELHNLTIPEWRALVVIAEHHELSPTAVGHHTAMDKVKVSRATQSLVAKGLLRQTQDPHDGRGRLLRLTRKGAATHARIVPLANRLESMLLDELSRADMAVLNRALSKITSLLETNGSNGRA